MKGVSSSGSEMVRVEMVPGGPVFLGEAMERTLDLDPGCAADQPAAPELSSVSLSFPACKMGLMVISATPPHFRLADRVLGHRTLWRLHSCTQRVGVAPVHPCVFQMLVFQFSSWSFPPPPKPSAASCSSGSGRRLPRGQDTRKPPG